MSYQGDFVEDATVYIPFNTFDSNDPSASVTITDLVAGDVEVYKDGVIQTTPGAGVTVNLNVGANNGSHMIEVDTSNTTDAGFYVTGADYQVRINGTTVDAATINAWVGSFSIQNRFMRGTDSALLAANVTVANGAIDAKVTYIMDTILTEGGAGRLAAAFIKLFDVTSPTGTVNSLPDAVPGAAGGGFIAGTNAQTAITTALTTVFDGDLTGAVGSVAGDVDGTVTGLAAKLLAYVQLLARSDAAITTDNSTELTEINANGGSGAGDYAATTDSQEAISDAGGGDATEAKQDSIIATLGTPANIDTGGATIADNLKKLADDGGGLTFDATTDSLEEIRDRGDAAWAGAPEAASGTFVVQTPDTIFDLTATLGTLSGNDDAYNNMIISMEDDSGGVFETRRITDYDGANTRVTLDAALTFPGEDGVDKFTIYRVSYAPVGAASITEGDKDDIVDKVWDESMGDHIAQGTTGQRQQHSGRGRY